jgi:hypothetical protein
MIMTNKDEAVMRRVRTLLAQAHGIEVGDRNPEAADALGAQAANLLAGVVYRNDRRANVIPMRRPA